MLRVIRNAEGGIVRMDFTKEHNNLYYCKPNRVSIVQTLQLNGISEPDLVAAVLCDGNMLQADELAILYREALSKSVEGVLSAHENARSNVVQVPRFQLRKESIASFINAGSRLLVVDLGDKGQNHEKPDTLLNLPENPENQRLARLMLDRLNSGDIKPEDLKIKGEDNA